MRLLGAAKSLDSGHLFTVLAATHLDCGVLMAWSLSWA